MDWIVSLLLAALSFVPSFGSQGIQQLQQWRATAGRVELASSTAALRIPSLASLDCLGTDAEGDIGEGTCTGGGVGSNWGFSSLSAITPTTSVGILVSASSTIGSGAQAGGLTISGGATTTGTAYFAGNVGIGTQSPSERLHISTAADEYATTLLQSGTHRAILFANQDDDAIGFGSQSNHAMVLVSNNTARLRAQADGDLDVLSNSFNFNAGGTTGSNYKWEQTEDDILQIQKSGGDDPSFSLLSLVAPTSDPQEATLALVRDLGGGNQEFVDIFTEDYSGLDDQAGIAVAKRGTGVLQPFSLRFWNASAGSIAAQGKYSQVWLPKGNTGIGMATSTTGSCVSVLCTASSTVPQLSLSGGTGIAQWAFRNMGGSLHLATTTTDGSATSTNSAIIVQPGATALGIGTTTFSGMLGIGPSTANGSSTVATGRWQIDGYNSAGTRSCTFLVGTTMTTVAGACNQ